MNRNQAKEFYPIMQAFAEGKVIERRTRTWELNKGWQYSTNWEKTEELKFQDTYEYRIKQEPVYRPFNNTKECWNEMQKHQPVGWLKSTEATEDVYFPITGLTNDKCGVKLGPSSGGGWSFSGLFDYYTFADGTPFGVKEKE